MKVKVLLLVTMMGTTYWNLLGLLVGVFLWGGWRKDLWLCLSCPAPEPLATRMLRLLRTSFNVARIWAKGVTICSSSSLTWRKMKMKTQLFITIHTQSLMMDLGSDSCREKSLFSESWWLKTEEHFSIWIKKIFMKVICDCKPRINWGTRSSSNFNINAWSSDKLVCLSHC